MNKEALQLQISLLNKFTEITLGLENQGMNYAAGNDLFFIEEDISLLKVLFGENHSMYKKMISLKESIDKKIADNKAPALFY